MDPTTIETIATWAGGTLVQGNPAQTVSEVCTDSRKIPEGSLFVALRGERFDAHDFVPQAAEAGAAAVLVEGGDLPPGVGCIKVDNTLAALQRIAGAYRQTLSLKVIGLTGSNGKTSTKDMTAAVLGRRYRVTRTHGNLNNHIGLPLTILRADSSHEIGVFEMGMNHPGEIAPLAALARPDVAIITSIGVAHIEFLGSRDGIAQEKGALAEALTPEGTLVLPAEDDYTPRLGARTKGRVLLAGIERGDVQACDIRAEWDCTRFVLKHGDQAAEATLAVPGIHMVRNAVLAVAVGRIFGLSLPECAEGLATVRLTSGRMERKELEGLLFLDDTYNANPDSMVAALETLVQMEIPGKRYAVLGRMGELGKESEAGHRRVGEAVATLGVDGLIVIGETAALIADGARRAGLENVFETANSESATDRLRLLVKAGDAILVKGSRAAAMERVVNAFGTTQTVNPTP